MKEMLEAARAAKGEVAGLSTEQKNAALNAMADALIAGQAQILDANALDMASAKEHISPVMLDRLKLTKERIAGMAQGIREVTALPDPVGRVLQTHIREDGLEIQKVSVPMGVIAIIYESRPNVTSDAAALALKAERLRPEKRKGGVPQRQRHCGRPPVRPEIGGYHGKRGESGAGHIPGKRRCADDRKRLH